MTPSPPRRPSRLTWPVLARLLGRSLAGLALVWMVALVAWPERAISCDVCATFSRYAVVRENGVVSFADSAPWPRDLTRRERVQRGLQLLAHAQPHVRHCQQYHRDSSLSALLGR